MQTTEIDKGLGYRTGSPGRWGEFLTVFIVVPVVAKCQGNDAISLLEFCCLAVLHNA